MTTKLFKLVVLTALVLVLAAVSFKLAVEWRARTAAQVFFTETTSENSRIETKLMAMNARIHEAYANQSAHNNPSLLFALRPYLSHDLLPEVLRIEKGAIEVLYVKGECDSAARTLMYILRKNGIPAFQLNFNTPSAAHSVVMARLADERRALLDPFFGVVARHDGQLIGPERAQELMRAGVPLESVFSVPDSAEQAHKFYKSFGQAQISLQGKPQTLAVNVGLPAGTVVHLGKVDGRSSDVHAASSKRGWYKHWHYLGHRYDRAWTRIISVDQDTRITFKLTGPVNDKFLTADREPTEINAQSVTYEVPNGEQITFIDGKAERDWLKMRSYQDVDAIEIEALD